MNELLPLTTESVPLAHLHDRDHQALVVEYNATSAPYPSHQTVVDLFRAQVAQSPDAEAIRFGAESLTYRQLNERSNQMAARLASSGVEPGRIVVVFMEHSIEVLVAILGILKSGAAYVPVDAATPKGRLATILKDIADGMGGQIPVAVTQASLQPVIPLGLAKTLVLDADFRSISGEPASDLPSAASPDGLAYIIFTSGSTGTPKGVMIEHRSLVNYIWWAARMYSPGERLAWPLFSSLAFDLTVTSLFTPLITGGRIVVYRGDPGVQSLVVFKVVDDNAVDIVKLTPAHLAMIRDRDLSTTRLRKFIVGGEDFKTELARDITKAIPHPVEIYNEYGPTEATVGCMIHRFDFERDQSPSVPIGTPAANAGIYVLDERHRPVPTGIVGEMYISGDGLAKGYFNQPAMTAQRFLTTADPRDQVSTLRLYKTGDLARWNSEKRLDFLGRADHQVQIGGARVELGEIEAQLLKHPHIQECAVTLVTAAAKKPHTQLRYCERCGLASDMPGATYDSAGVCNLCRAFDTYVDKAQGYFKTPDDLEALIREMQEKRKGPYDCIVLLSGGKDSSFMLSKLCAMGVNPLVFTLDNGFISEEAKTNIRRLVNTLGVDLHWGSTPHMNEIFVDSLKRFANVCNGCFKTIYTLATNLAREKGISYIVTGLSRGQFFETRLTEEVFKRDDYAPERLDALVVEARKEYHRRDDAVSRYLDVDIFRSDSVFEEVKFIDFYRYWSVPLEDMLEFLKTQVGWSRPSDTGRSTNCLINDLGIYVHKKQRGYHNYSLPYSWDVRLGQKTRDEAIDELNDEIDVHRIKEIMAEIGYVEPAATEDGIARLVAYYVPSKNVSVADLRAHLTEHLPEAMMPTHFVSLERMPLTTNGKIDRTALPDPTADNIQVEQDFIAPETATEKTLAALWCDLLKVDSIGRNDNFFNLGGHSLLVMRAVSRLRETFGVDVQLRNLFERPTVAGLAEVIDGMLWMAGARASSPSHGPREEIEL
ncbi:amino acid adenylation domain-containing protein [Microvirga sp. M2]|uniref:amino acid adenylation domain-containing protein n=1 Tax=Microvirga sp. M2 TaxID=3073270 RepID=UPI0039C2F816